MLRYVIEHALVKAADSERTASAAAELKAALENLRELPAVGDVRGMGLLWGIEFVADKKPDQCPAGNAVSTAMQKLDINGPEVQKTISTLVAKNEANLFKYVRRWAKICEWLEVCDMRLCLVVGFYLSCMDFHSKYTLRI